MTSLKKWDDVLLGLPEISIVTDHEALKTFMHKSHAGLCQILWCQWLLQFRLKFIHVPRVQNRSADAMSHIYENPNSKPRIDDLSTVDLLIDPEGDDLPEQCLQEKKIHHLMAMTHAHIACDTAEPRDMEAAALIPLPREEPAAESTAEVRTTLGNEDLTVANSNASSPPAPFVWQGEIEGEKCLTLEKLCRDSYTSDKILQTIMDRPGDHKLFEVKDGLIHYLPDSETRATCIPHAKFWGRKVTELVIDQVHRIVTHMGPCIMTNYARRYFWWPTLGSNIKAFCNSCATCQAMKMSNQWPQGLLHSLPIPTTPWSSIGMDFVGPFPLSDEVDYIWVVLC